MRAPDRQLLAVVAELQQAIAAGRQPQLTNAEWAALAAYIQSRGKRRRHRGQHRSMTRYLKGAKRRMLRSGMEALKIKLRHDPAELELKRAMRANGGRYVLNERVAQRMHERLQKSGRDPVPTVSYLRNVLSRSTAGDWVCRGRGAKRLIKIAGKFPVGTVIPTGASRRVKTYQGPSSRSPPSGQPLHTACTRMYAFPRRR
jgi:hypothetical protein